MHKFESEAMNTSINLFIDGVTEGYAASAADNVFWILSNLDTQLSMFADYSEISAINAMKPGQSRIILESTMQALAGAMYVSSLSGGAFDVCKGEYFLKAKSKRQIENPKSAKIALDPDGFIVHKIEDGIVDLGAIGKGFAIDVMAEALTKVWEIDKALISFGGSSIIALNPPDGKDSWDVTFAGQKLPGLKVRNCAIGASGTAVNGEHIIDCRTGLPPKNPPYRAWAICDNGLLADGFSTAFMLLSEDEISEICKKENMRATIQKTPDGEVVFIG